MVEYIIRGDQCQEFDLSGLKESERRESNPRTLLGRQAHCHCATLADFSPPPLDEGEEGKRELFLFRSNFHHAQSGCWELPPYGWSPEG